ncbi:hypothetical protein HYH03_005498 [Edaphochlamys debaryana]|uniref:J domain-containing protein n=1 Tax=Edaphochlamys debaryana TaxID=47281 RepID=A0A835YCC7_9CHLO|nr:hypothetical protein HYH03_005498 [Edaphochlamys debaryana]|eukprot:KAG2496265.1 hypothetical protein HYH03_005498 [Edaphochlamys debaryana]
MRGAVLPRPSRCAAGPRSGTAPFRRPATTVRASVSSYSSLDLRSKCPYELLGVSQDADEDSIKTAFRRRAKECHPDVNPHGCSIEFMECQAAYELLLDQERRAKYDNTLRPRATAQVLSYLNARSAARHGVPVSRVPSRAPYMDRPQLYSTMLELLQQVKSCAKNLEREIGVQTDMRRRPVPVRATPASAQSSKGRAAASEPCNVDCGEGDCCEPWVYYAAAAEAAEASQSDASRRRR